jgi:hypothetical protein
MGKYIHLECSLTSCYVVVHQFVPGELNPQSTLPLGAIKAHHIVEAVFGKPMKRMNPW